MIQAGPAVLVESGSDGQRFIGAIRPPSSHFFLLRSEGFAARHYTMPWWHRCDSMPAPSRLPWMQAVLSEVFGDARSVSSFRVSSGASGPKAWWVSGGFTRRLICRVARGLRSTYCLTPESCRLRQMDCRSGTCRKWARPFASANTGGVPQFHSNPSLPAGFRLNQVTGFNSPRMLSEIRSPTNPIPRPACHLLRPRRTCQ